MPDRLVQMPRLARVKAGYACSVVVASVGLGIELGTGWGLAIGGAVSAASFLFLAETDDDGAPFGRRG